MFFLFFLVFFFTLYFFRLVSINLIVSVVLSSAYAIFVFRKPPVYDPPCHYNKGQVTLMCQQLSDYVVGSYTKCVNKRRYISWTLGEIPAPIDHIQCSRHSVKMAKTQVYCGMFVHSTKKDYMRILQNHAIGVKEGKVGININSMCLYNLLWSCRTKSLSEVFS